MDQYIHGYTSQEQRRLAKLNELLNFRCLSLLTLVPGMRVLDVGSGLGMFSAQMADQVGPTGRVLGVEKSEAQLERAAVWLEGRPQLSYRQGDAYHLPFEDIGVAAFDLAHTRFLLEHVQRPARVVGQMFQAVRPGGQVVLVDDDHLRFTLYPELPAFDVIWFAYLKSYEVMGNDPYVGRKLVALLKNSGCRSIRNDFIFFGSNADQSDFADYVRNIAEIIEQARSVITEHRLLAESEFEEGLRAFQQWQHHPHATIWYQVCWAEGTKPES
ncbi:MAG: methyltransferase domain-containing protein [Saprospiraceae bacterium]